MRQVSGTLTVQAARHGLHEITREVADWVAENGLQEGLLTLFLRHTSAALLVQENADPDLQRDLEDFFAALAPEDPGRYRHRSEGPDDMPAHLKAALTQVHLAVPVAAGRLRLGTWQGIYLFELRNRPRPREIALHWLGE